MELEINDQNYAEIIKSAPVVLIDFWAPWCGPCRSLAPTVAEIAEQYAGKAIVAKCNVDECDDVPADCGIRSIPTLIYYKNGQVADRSVGAVPKSDIEAKLNALL